MCKCCQVRPLRLFEVLTRNRQSALDSGTAAGGSKWEYLVEREYDEYDEGVSNRIRPLRLFEVLTRNRQSAKIRILPRGRLKMVSSQLEYLVERKYNKYVESACQYAAKFGHLDCLKYLHKTARAPLDYLAVREATKNNQTECLRYLLDNYGPLPYGWRYEHGELRVPESEVFSVPNPNQNEVPNHEYNILVITERERERLTACVRSSRFHLFLFLRFVFFRDIALF